MKHKRSLRRGRGPFSVSPRELRRVYEAEYRRAHRVANRMLDMAERLLESREAQGLDTVVRDYVSEAIMALVERACSVGYDGDWLIGTFHQGDAEFAGQAAVVYRTWVAFGAAAYIDALGFNLRYLDERMRTLIGWTEKDGGTIWPKPRRTKYTLPPRKRKR